MPKSAEIRQKRGRPQWVSPWLIAIGAAILMCASALPGLSRLVVLPALLLAPGYAFLAALGRDAEIRAASLAVPVSLALVMCAALALDVSGIRLDALSLGSLLGAATALFLAGAYGRELISARRRYRRRRSAIGETAQHEAVDQQGVTPPQ